MARYIKANPLVAKFLQLENDRNTVSDGNYLLWQADMLKFGPLTDLQATLEKIGGLALAPHEARQEQDGTNVRTLPLATDDRFKVIITPTEEEAEEEPAADAEEEATATEEDTVLEEEEA